MPKTETGVLQNRGGRNNLLDYMASYSDRETLKREFLEQINK